MTEHNREAEQTLDAALARALREAHERMEPPDGELAWERMQRKLASRSKQQTWLRVGRFSGVAATAALLLVLTLNWTGSTYAFEHLFLVVKKAKNGATHVFYGPNDPKDTRGAKTAPPPDIDEEGSSGWVSPSRTEGGTPPSGPPAGAGDGEDVPDGRVLPQEELPLEDALRKLDFQLKLPQQLPRSFVVDKAEITQDPDGKYRSIRIEYRNDAREFMALSAFYLVDENAGSTAMSFSDPQTKVSEVDIRGSKGVLVTMSRSVMLHWRGDRVQYSLDGQLTADEALQLARSIK